MPPKETITFTETDEVSNPTATYVYSESKSSERRLDVLRRSAPSEWSYASVVNSFGDIFLPAGYPYSVSDDYLPYQVFDSLQAFCSSIAGLLSSRAVLQGVGVGNASASPTSALLLHILQDSSGRIATILFAHRVGTALEPECKMYRLLADIFNDIAMILDCLSPLIPAGACRVSVLSTAGVLRALCGVAGGSSKASLSAHFSRWGNLAEVNAKDSSQETIISLIGMLVGSFVVSRITGFAATWIALILLLAAHLGMNYAAVRSVQMTSLNRQRANLVFSALLESDPDLDLDNRNPGQQKRTNQTRWTLLTPAETSNQERIFYPDNLLAWDDTQKLGFCHLGVNFPSFLGAPVHLSTSVKPPTQLSTLTALFASERYMLLFARRAAWEGRVVLKPDCSVEDRLKAWCHALLAARILADSGSDVQGEELVLDVASRTLGFLTEGCRFQRYVESLKGVGWDLDIAALETRPGRRVSWS